MKKMVLVISLAVIILLTGCAPAATPEVSAAPAVSVTAAVIAAPKAFPDYSNSEVAGSLILKASYRVSRQQTNKQKGGL